MEFKENQTVRGEFKGIEFKGLVREEKGCLVKVLLDRRSQEALRTVMPSLLSEVWFESGHLKRM